MKIFLYLALFLLVVFTWLVRKKNKQEADAIKKRMGLKALEARYENEIGVIRSKEDIKAFFKQFRLTQYWDAFEPKIRDELRITTVENADTPLGGSRFGGQPDLPKNAPWFKDGNGKSLSFVAQLNLEEIQSFNHTPRLPEKGMVTVGSFCNYW